MKLLLMRHGEASFNASTDDQRPLTQQGRACVSAQSQDKRVVWQEFSKVLVSPFLRAQQTATILLSNVAFKAHPPIVETTPAITPHGKVNQVQDLLLNQQEKGLVLVMHEPLISALIGHFCHQDKHMGEPMMPGSMAILEGDIAAAGCLTLTHLYHPSEKGI